jgi:serine O-acetyltransferase
MRGDDAVPLMYRYLAHSHVLTVAKASYWLWQHQIPLLPKLAKQLIRILWSADIPYRVLLPEGSVLFHNALGVVIHGKTQFEGPCFVFPHVTIGNSWGTSDGAPTIGPYVLVGTGAKILGNVTVGPYSIIGANTVVTRDTPPYSLVRGVPATTRPLDRELAVKVFGRMRRGGSVEDVTTCLEDLDDAAPPSSPLLA